MTYYYSFLVGHPRTPKSTWMIKETKLPADCVRNAIVLDIFRKRLTMEMHRGFKGMAKSKTLNIPDWDTVNSSYRQVIEYERKFTPGRGKTIHQFVKVKIYNFHEFEKLFK